ncbi:hypothetical protein [Paucibacter sp. XJ19-41]|uniref:hypothetical protein n=1 Tax=Paucibacter sp. XJ19-41 TaxID=2927824 RepID=UPI00234931BD|nr:hypothetical protein [Paucibacter sp. XJ19-41]MDC6166246.1 hypothetical protein [Paucibacter sp. XJ19-41]
MRKNLTFALAVLIATGSSLAEGLSRQEVVAELERARASGELARNHSENPDFHGPTLTSGSKVSRADVLAQLERARASGELARSQRESYEPPVPTGPGLSRTEVVAELLRARASGELAILHSNRNDFGGSIEPKARAIRSATALVDWTK